MDKIKFAHLCVYIGYLITQGACLTDYQVSEIDTLINDGMPHRGLGYTDAAMEEFMTAMHDGRKIDAIKAHRTMSGMGLKESKDFVEKHWQFEPPAPAQN